MDVRGDTGGPDSGSRRRELGGSGREHRLARPARRDKGTWRDAQAKPRERLLDQPFSIGRDPACAIRFEDPLVSRRHVEIGLADGIWYVADLGSRNGTLLDGVAIKREPLPKKRCTLRLSSQGPDIDLEFRPSAAPTTLLAPQGNR